MEILFVFVRKVGLEMIVLWMLMSVMKVSIVFFLYSFYFLSKGCNFFFLDSNRLFFLYSI